MKYDPLSALFMLSAIIMMIDAAIAISNIIILTRISAKLLELNQIKYKYAVSKYLLLCIHQSQTTLNNHF